MRDHIARWAAVAAAVVAVSAGCVEKPTPPADRSSKPPVLSGDYLGRTPPGAAPELFAPGLVSTGLYERDVAMTPDGNELYFGLIDGGYVAIAVLKRLGGAWSGPEIAPFCDNPEVFDLEPHIVPDGQRFLFLSTRPREGQELKKGWANQDIWAMDRTPEGWSAPYNLGAPVNTDAPEFFPSVTRGGTLYFTREIEQDGKRRNLILRARPAQTSEPGGAGGPRPGPGGPSYAEPEILPAAVNPGDQQFNAFVDPEERYLIVCIAGREDNIGACDYYVAFRDSNDVWTGPINMGAAVNTPGNTVGSPYVSPDGRYFFFASNRRSDAAPPARERTYRSIQEMAARPQNGNSDIYWMDASFIEHLRRER
ncbi:MAG: hypothetical protein H6Q78_328 [Candidatus Krumholzibacteriota bacterium]|nr:hypothetical protein [Candidatus Krumholzibacteriota bacterium]